MGLRAWIARWITRVLFRLGMNPEPRRTPDGGPIQSPIEHGEDDPDDERVHVAIYRTEGLDGRCGDAPGQTVARYVASALEHAGLGYRVDFGFDPVGLDDPGIGEFADADLPLVAKDANLLLTDSGGGGKSFLGGKWGIMGCGRIERVLDHRWEGERREDGNVHGALHEVLHQLGIGHDMDPEATGLQFPGMAERVDRWRWRRTPMAGGTGHNSCGEPIDSRPDTPGLITVRVQRYHDCSVESIEIADGPIPAPESGS